MARRLRHDEYTVGWVCALADELTAAQEMLDEEHEHLPQHAIDTNVYSLGRIGEHNVVLACLPAGLMGTTSATAVAMQMRATFPAIRFGLMVGIGGGVPSRDADVRLGDVVVSQPGKGHGGVIQFDFGKSTPTGFERTGFLNAPPQILLTAVNKLRSNQDRGRNSLSPHLSKLGSLPHGKFARRTAGHDILFDANYNHVTGDNCDQCDRDRRVPRNRRPEKQPLVHYGIIASGNQVMRNGEFRDEISAEFGGVLCFEMEAAGLTNNFPCLVIRGVCDYADSHKNKKWQPYAAGTAAAYAKELLSVLPAADTQPAIADQTAMEDTRVYLPFPRNRKFIGRNTVLNVLKKNLFINKDCQKMSLVGLGGVGKTQVALQFAYWVKDHYPDFSIFWVPALSIEAFEQACRDIARMLKISESQRSGEEVRRLVQQRLSAKSTGNWLLIVDNADDLDILRGSGQGEALIDFIPETENGVTLYTTRHSEVAQYVTGSDMVELEKMEAQDAIDLLERSLAQKRLLQDAEQVDNLLAELEYLPLAITQAAAYINTNKSPITEYLRLLKNTDRGAVILTSTEFSDRSRYKNQANAIGKTWTITFNQITQRNRVAADILAFISCIEWKAIPISILPGVESQAVMEHAIGTLCSYSFVERSDDGKKLDMHRLVHLATKTWIKEVDREEETRKNAVEHLSALYPRARFRNRHIWRDYLPHVVRIANDVDGEDIDKSELYFKIGASLTLEGRDHEAVRWHQRSCAWRKNKYDEYDAKLLKSQYELGRSYYKNGEPDESIKLLEHVAAIRTATLEEDDPYRLDSQHELAIAYRQGKQPYKALELLEEVVQMRQKTLGEDHLDLLASQRWLACLYEETGKVKKAIKLHEHVASRTTHLPEDDRHRLAVRFELASAYRSNGQIREAIELLEHVVAMSKRIRPEEHPDNLDWQYSLAEAYNANGQHEKAIEILDHLVKVRHRTLAEHYYPGGASENALAYYRDLLSDEENMLADSMRKLNVKDHDRLRSKKPKHHSNATSTPNRRSSRRSEGHELETESKTRSRRVRFTKQLRNILNV